MHTSKKNIFKNFKGAYNLHGLVLQVLLMYLYKKNQLWTLG